MAVGLGGVFCGDCGRLLPDDTRLLAQDRANCVYCGSKIRATRRGASDQLGEPNEGVWFLADGTGIEKGSRKRRVVEGFTGYNPARGVIHVFQRRDDETREQLETRITRRLLNLRGEPYTKYANHEQPSGYPDQLILDANGATEVELELVGPGDQARSAEMNLVVDELRREIASRKIGSRLSSLDIRLECLFRQPSRHTRDLIVRETLNVLNDASKAEVRPTPGALAVPAPIATYVSSINLVPSSIGGGLAVVDILGAPLSEREAITEILESIRAKTEKNYLRSHPGVPLELLVHSSGFSDIRWSPEYQFIDNLAAKVEREKATWAGSFNRVWLLSGNAYREVCS